ncbi:MAG TPA: endonuclease/exonuclease/phosphatase family protein [Gemmatimonadales bacterium]|nr:endonuclease/exonuclease/phosphatase family protein [Gemmatimonadales bacterium]
MHRVVLAALLALGCRGFNYASPSGPRYAAAEPPAPVAPAGTPGGVDSIRVVTFNVKFARHIDQAITLLRSTAALQNADVITLQEMDETGTRRIAAALAMSYVYYPATIEHHRDFGNAVLSRWPIVADEKIVLPHHAWFIGTQRIATAATINVRGVPLRVYSLHLGTRMEIGPGSRRDQVQAVLANAAAYPRVVIGGDMNSRGIGKTFRAAGFLWPTERNPRTHFLGNWDHIFLKGLTPADSLGTGVARDTIGASDHRPVWALALLAAH